MEYWKNIKIENLIYKANQLKLQGHWLDAGDVFCEAAELHRHKGSQQAIESAAICLKDAANCFKKAAPSLNQRYAILANEAAASLHAQLGQFVESATIHEDIAELAKAMGRQDRTGGSWPTMGDCLDKVRIQKLKNLQLAYCLDAAASKSDADTGTSSVYSRSVNWMKSWLPSSTPKPSILQQSYSGATGSSSAPDSASQAPSAMQLAVRHYQMAADHFSAENLTARECECLTKKAELLTEIGELEAAAQQFLELARRAMCHELLAFGAVNIAFKACLCCLQAASECLEDTQSSDRLLAQAETECPAFARSEEAAFVREIAEAVRASSRSSKERAVAALDDAKRRFENGNSTDDFCFARLVGLRKALSGDVQLM